MKGNKNVSKDPVTSVQFSFVDQDKLSEVLKRRFGNKSRFSEIYDRIHAEKRRIECGSVMVCELPDDDLASRRITQAIARYLKNMEPELKMVVRATEKPSKAYIFKRLSKTNK